MDKKEKVDELETDEALPPGQNVNEDKKRKWVGISSLCSWWDLMRQCFWFGSKAVDARSEVARGLVMSEVVNSRLAAHKSSCKLHLQETR